MSGLIYQFGDFQLDCGRFELTRNGKPLRVERKPMELLILLASRQGQLVTRSEIAQRLWSNDVFVDKEHGINTAVRKLRHLLRDDADEPKFIQTVTGMGYRFIATVTTIEVPQPEPDQANEDLQVPVEQPTGTSEAGSKPRRFRIAVAAGVTVAVASLALTVGPHPLAARLLHRNTPLTISSIAVLPLDNLSGDRSQDYFADGMTDELITMLAKESTLRIPSRTSVMQYKDAHRPLSEIARGLNVDAILEGSVSRSADHVHLDLQLIRADTDTHLWAESYDRNASDVVSLSVEAAKTIAAELKSSLPSPPAAPPIRPEAHDAYLRGEYLWYQGRDRDAIKQFNLAISMQPDYAAAWSSLAASYGQGASSGEFAPEEAMPKAESAAARALELDPSLADAHLSMGAVIATYHRDLVRGDQEILKAMELDPHLTQAVHFHAMVLAAMNRRAEGIEVQKRASELDPAVRPWSLPRAYLWARDYDAALNDALPKVKANPDVEYLNYWVSKIYQAKGMEKEAAPYLEKWLLFSSSQDLAPQIQRAYREGGYRGLVIWQLDQMKKKSRTQYVSPVSQASLSAELGDREKTLAFLEQGIARHDPEMIWIQCDPEFDFLHADPRYRALVQRVGLPPSY